MPVVFTSPVPATGLPTLCAHKYKAGKSTACDNLFNTYVWTPSLSLVPASMAPNTVTLLGTIIMASTALVLEGTMHVKKMELASKAAYTLEAAGEEALAEVPFWAHVYTAFCVFLYQTLDALDGKQARRTDSSSPLGQLFDHGCDALVTAICMHNLMPALGLSPTSTVALFACVVALTVFCLAQWEESYTHTLRTNAGGVGVTEAQLALMLVHLVTAAFGSGFWSTAVRLDLGFGSMSHGFSLPLNEIVAGGAALVGLMPIGRFVLNVVIWEKHGLQALRTASATFLLAISALLAFLPQGLTGIHLTLLHQVPGLMLGLYMLSQTFLSTQTIVLSMAQQRPTFSDTLAALAFPAIVLVDWLTTRQPALFEPAMAKGLARTAFAVGALVMFTAYGSFVVSAIYQISTALGIRTFRISPKAPQPQHAPAVTATAATAASGHAEQPVPTPPAPVAAPTSSSSRRRGSSTGAGARSPSASRESRKKR